MKRRSFLKQSLLGFTGLSLLPEIATGKTSFRLRDIKEQVGHNHIPNKEITTMKTILHKAETRGAANHGWLEAKHSFSFANYYNPERIHFGALRVLNDDKIAGGKGFGTHPHRDMEIITIPLHGDLEHKDSMGNHGIIQAGDVQVMSAGTGIQHSEFNKNNDKDLKLLQIWVIPNKERVTPRYDQITLDSQKQQNQWHQILSPNPNDEGVWIHQDAWFHLADLDPNVSLDYTLKQKGNGVYAFVIDGELTLNEQALEPRDGYGLWDTPSFTVKATTKAKILLMEVPMI